MSFFFWQNSMVFFVVVVFLGTSVISLLGQKCDPVLKTLLSSLSRSTNRENGINKKTSKYRIQKPKLPIIGGWQKINLVQFAPWLGINSSLLPQKAPSIPHNSLKMWINAHASLNLLNMPIFYQLGLVKMKFIGKRLQGWVTRVLKALDQSNSQAPSIFRRCPQ